MSPFDPGVPLSDYLPLGEEMGVRFDCANCRASHDVALADVVAKLKDRGIGDERTGIREVGRLSTVPCARCGAVRWQTMPAHHPRPPRK